MVHVPSVGVEDARHASRARTMLQQERTRYRNRLHGLLMLHGVRLRLDAQFPPDSPARPIGPAHLCPLGCKRACCSCGECWSQSTGARHGAGGGGAPGASHRDRPHGRPAPGPPAQRRGPQCHGLGDRALESPDPDPARTGRTHRPRLGPVCEWEAACRSGAHAEWVTAGAPHRGATRTRLVAAAHPIRL